MGAAVLECVLPDEHAAGPAVPECLIVRIGLRCSVSGPVPAAPVPATARRSRAWAGAAGQEVTPGTLGTGFRIVPVPQAGSVTAGTGDASPRHVPGGLLKWTPAGMCNPEQGLAFGHGG